MTSKSQKGISGQLRKNNFYRLSNECVKALQSSISIGNYTVREVLMKNRTSVWRNVYNTASA